MIRCCLCWALLAAGSITLSGQRLLVLSEYTRLRPDGEVVQVDRAERRREVISPAVARNAFATFRVAVEAPAGSSYNLYIGQNPENTAEVTLYQEKYTRVGEEWVGDEVKRVDLPHGAVLSDGQKVQTYLLDVWLPDTTPVGRFRLEVQLNVGERWVIYPLEVRVQAAMAPAKATVAGPLPGAERRLDEAVRAAACEYLSGQPARDGAVVLERVAAFVERNVRQDLMLARQGEDATVGTAILRAGGLDSSRQLCTEKVSVGRGAEWWLRVRDYLYQGLSVR